MKIHFLDLLDDHARLYLVRIRGGEVDIKEIYSGPLKDIKPTKKRLIVNLPYTAVNFRILQFPFREEDKIRDVVTLELKGMTIRPPEDLVCEIRFLGQSNKMYKVLVGYVEKERLLSIVNTLKGLGIKPLRVTSLSFYRDDILAERYWESDDEEFKELLKRDLLDRRINFLAHTENEEEKRLLRQTLLDRVATILILLSLFAGINLMIDSYQKRKEIEKMEDFINTTYSDVFPGSRIVAPLLQIKAKIKESERQLRTLQSIHPLEILSMVSRHWYEGVSADEIILTGQRIVIRGTVGSLKDVQTLKDRLLRTFQTVNIKSTERISTDMLRFAIEIPIEK